MLGNDINDRVLLVGIDDQSALHGIIEGIEHSSRDLALIVYCSAGNGLLIRILRQAFAVCSTPVRIQSVGLHALIQLSDQLTAGSIGVPAFKLIAGICRYSADLGVCVGIIALSLDLTYTAIGIKANIGNVAGQVVVVNTVEVHIGFCQATADQRRDGLAACSAPLAKGKQQIVTGPALNYGGVQGAGFVQPGAAAVIAQRQNRVEHTLGKGQTILINKLIDSLGILIQVIQQLLFSILSGNADGLIFLQLAVGYASTITNGPLLVVPIGLGAKAFPLFNNVNAFLTCGEISSSLCRNCSHRDQRNQQGNCQGQTNDSFLHSVFSSQNLVTCTIQNLHDQISLHIWCYYSRTGDVLQPLEQNKLHFCYLLYQENVSYFSTN